MNVFDGLDKVRLAQHKIAHLWFLNFNSAEFYSLTSLLLRVISAIIEWFLNRQRMNLAI